MDALDNPAQEAPERRRRSGPRSRSSPYLGVTLYKKSLRWEAHIWLKSSAGKGKQHHLGSYKSAEEAAKVYDIAAIKTRSRDPEELNFKGVLDAEAEAFLAINEKVEKMRFLDLLREKYAIPPVSKPIGRAPRRRPAKSNSSKSSSSSSSGGSVNTTDSEYKQPKKGLRKAGPAAALAAGRVRKSPTPRHPPTAAPMATANRGFDPVSLAERTDHIARWFQPDELNQMRYLCQQQQHPPTNAPPMGIRPNQQQAPPPPMNAMNALPAFEDDALLENPLLDFLPLPSDMMMPEFFGLFD